MRMEQKVCAEQSVQGRVSQTRPWRPIDGPQIVPKNQIGKHKYRGRAPRLGRLDSRREMLLFNNWQHLNKVNFSSKQS